MVVIDMKIKFSVMLDEKETLELLKILGQTYTNGLFPVQFDYVVEVKKR
jgi:hypothetical protein